MDIICLFSRLVNLKKVISSLTELWDWGEVFHTSQHICEFNRTIVSFSLTIAAQHDKL